MVTNIPPLSRDCVHCCKDAFTLFFITGFVFLTVFRVIDLPIYLSLIIEEIQGLQVMDYLLEDFKVN